MSIQAIAWVLEHSEATLADRLVLLAIANHADARGWNAWPSIPLIASEARVDDRTVYRAIEALEKRGEIIVERRRGRPNRYAVALQRGDKLSGVHPWQDVRGPLTSTTKTPDILPGEPLRTVNEPSRARARDSQTVPDWVPNGPCQGPTGEQRAAGIRAIRQILRKDPG